MYKQRFISCFGQKGKETQSRRHSHVLSVSPVKDLRDLRHHSRLRSSDTADGPTSSIRNGVHDEWFHFLLAILERLLDDL